MGARTRGELERDTRIVMALESIANSLKVIGEEQAEQTILLREFKEILISINSKN